MSDQKSEKPITVKEAQQRLASLAAKNPNGLSDGKDPPAVSYPGGLVGKVMKSE